VGGKWDGKEMDGSGGGSYGTSLSEEERGRMRGGPGGSSNFLRR
jgi:hypothetical protein